MFLNNLPIKHSIKHFFVRVSLGFLRALIVVKRVGVPFSIRVFQPFKTVGFVLLKVIGVPLYRVIFSVRRFVTKIILPAKSRFFYLLSNRYSIHVFIITLMAIVGVTNIQARHVRAETFGQQSILYSLVSVDDSQTIETVTAERGVPLSEGTFSYTTDALTIALPHTDVDFYPEQFFSTTETTEDKIATRSGIEMYTVVDGDTLGRIAIKFQLSISTILSANNLTLRSTIRIGDTLKILPEDGVLYTVVRGDTLSKIAGKYKIEITEIARANTFGDEQVLQVGTDIVLPGAEEIIKPQAIARRPVSVKDIFVPTSSSDSGSSKNEESVSSMKSGCVWPSSLRVITQYYNWKHTGIDIDGDYETYNLAAHDGVVSYTGWRNGYGLTVEIDHGNGFKTRYAHNSKNFVEIGDVVVAGEKIAQTGTTGHSTGTHLHFEIIKNGRFQNPLGYIR